MKRAALWRPWAHGPLRETLAASLRVSVALIGVMLAGLVLGKTPAIIPLLLGVIASALAETDDNWRGRLLAQVTTLLCFALIVFAVKASFAQPLALMLVLGGGAFLLTLLGAVGERYRSIAAATLIMLIYAALALQAQAGKAGGGQAVYLLAGAAWHGLISVLWTAAFPRPPVEQALARLFDALGGYLALKSKMFEPVRGVDRDRLRLDLALHNGRVVDALNGAKESLLSRQHGAPPPWLESALHQFFVAQDVHERTTSSHESYELLAAAFFHSDLLYRCERVLALLGDDCVALAAAIRRREPWTRDEATAHAVEDLAAAVSHAISHAEAGGLPPVAEIAHAQRAKSALRALAANLGAMSAEVASIQRDEGLRLPADTALQDIHPRTLGEFARRLRAQLTLASPLMRHAIRLSLALMAGYELMRITGDSYGFWIPLTIVFVCQPRWATTLARFVERIGGTVLGLLIGWAFLKLFPDPLAQAAFVVIAAILFFIWRADRYLLATAAITAFVLLAFNQVGNGFDAIVPRLFDTLAGCLIAGFAVWLILPVWNARRLHALGADALRAQARYLGEIMAQYGFAGKDDNLAYRIARRDAHNADAAFSGALAAAFKEPAYVRGKVAAGRRFLVLAHTLLNYLSALGAHRDARLASDDVAVAAANSLTAALEGIAAQLTHTGSTPAPRDDESAILASLFVTKKEEEGEHQRILRAQLSLALGLLPELRQAAKDLA